MKIVTNSYWPVIKRDGRKQSYDTTKIHDAVFRCAYNGVGWSEGSALCLADAIVGHCGACLRSDRSYGVEEIQDLIEGFLMSMGHTEVARAYILYREEHRKLREENEIDADEAARIESNQQYFPHPIQEFQFYSKYARWNEEMGRRETWEECVERVIDFFRRQFPTQFTGSEWEEMRQSILRMEAMPSMRLMQMAGPAAERCNIALYNCAYLPIDSLSAFSEILYILMQGTGVGFSVEEKYIRQLPQVLPQKNQIAQRVAQMKGEELPRAEDTTIRVHIHIVEDSTEGWCNALWHGLDAWYNGCDPIFDYSEVRPQGARLKTKGGRASGSGPLMQLIEFARNRVLARQGGYLTTEDAHDIACMCGYIVQVGGVRRAAMISLSDLNDVRMRDAKVGQFWIDNPQRSMSNNSAVYQEEPSSRELMRELVALADSGTGERGFFNRGAARRQIPQRRQLADFGVNPCGEIWLRPRGLCNLSIAVARWEDTPRTLLRKVRMAAQFGTMQSALTKFNYLPDAWRFNAEDERLLGVDITGQMDCSLLTFNPGIPSCRNDLLKELKDEAIRVNVRCADRLGIRPSAAVTCVKPSGNSAQLFNCSSGIHPRYAKHYIRRVRSGAYDPISKLLRESGVPCHPEVGTTWENASVWVFEFPVRAPRDAVTRHDMKAIEQLNNWMDWKIHFTEHNPSATIYVQEHEWIVVAYWLQGNWEYVGGLSFLPKDDGDHVYQLAPYEEISEEEYDKRMDVFPTIPWWKLSRYEKEDQTTSSLDYACISGVCEL